MYSIRLNKLELKRVYEQADKDASSGLSFEEFVTAVESLPDTLQDRRNSMKNLQGQLTSIATPLAEDADSKGKKKKDDCCVM